MSGAIEITGRDLDPAAIVRIARRGAKVVLGAEATGRIEASRQVVEDIVRRGERVYGVTSSVGAKTGVMLAPERVAEFNRRLLLTHNMGHGPLASHEAVRAMMAVLLNGMASGYLGVRRSLADRLVEALNSDRRIEVHLWGSMGESDMSPISDLALELYRDHDFAAGEALALLNSSALSLGMGAMALHDLGRQLRVATLVGALSMEGFAANPSVVSEAALASRPFGGVLRHGGAIRRYLQGSYLTKTGGPRHLQDPLSFRSLPLIHGAAADSLDFAERQVAIELRASQNNPVVAIEQGQLVSVANFDMVALSMALDVARLAFSPVVTSSTERLAKQADSFWSGPQRRPDRGGWRRPAGLQRPGAVPQVDHLRSAAAGGSGRRRARQLQPFERQSRSRQHGRARRPPHRRTRDAVSLDLRHGTAGRRAGGRDAQGQAARCDDAAPFRLRARGRALCRSGPARAAHQGAARSSRCRSGRDRRADRGDLKQAGRLPGRRPAACRCHKSKGRRR